MTIANRICAFLRESPFNITQLANVAGVTKNEMFDAKNGKNIEGDTLIKILNASLKFGLRLPRVHSAALDMTNNELIITRLINEEIDLSRFNGAPNGEKVIEQKIIITRLPFWAWANNPEF